MLIGPEDHLQNRNLVSENEDVNCQKHDRNTRMKCIFFSSGGNYYGRSQIPSSHSYVEKKHFDPGPAFKHTFTLEVPSMVSVTFLGSVCL